MREVSGEGSRETPPPATEEAAGRDGGKDRGEVRSYVHIFHEWCKGCGICVAFCPKKVLEMGRGQKAHVVHPELCIKCYMCARRCPDLAVTVTEELERMREEGETE
ncbi:4Fe-4S binding protein [Candidatus Fermentibacteria bacterium]|nr:4Fe-4S binding protein [Candidatus Fermentibacteria bacterium]